jgi:hypothetical protein
VFEKISFLVLLLCFCSIIELDFVNTLSLSRSFLSDNHYCNRRCASTVSALCCHILFFVDNAARIRRLRCLSSIVCVIKSVIYRDICLYVTIKSYFSFRYLQMTPQVINKRQSLASLNTHKQVLVCVYRKFSSLSTHESILREFKHLFL